MWCSFRPLRQRHVQCVVRALATGTRERPACRHQRLGLELLPVCALGSDCSDSDYPSPALCCLCLLLCLPRMRGGYLAHIVLGANPLQCCISPPPLPAGLCAHFWLAPISPLSTSARFLQDTGRQGPGKWGCQKDQCRSTPASLCKKKPFSHLMWPSRSAQSREGVRKGATPRPISALPLGL